MPDYHNSQAFESPENVPLKERPLNGTDGYLEDGGDMPFRDKQDVYTKNPSCLRIIILVLLILLFILLTLLLIILFLYFQNTSKTSNTCMSSECVTTAGNIIKSMNPKMDPCDDFFEYACGGWLDSHYIPDDKRQVSNFDTLSTNVNYALREMLDEDNPNEFAAIHKAKQFYRMCQDTGSIATIWEQVFQSYIVMFGGWPVLGLVDGPASLPWQKRGSEYSLELLYANLTKLFSASYFFKFSVQPDDKNSSQSMLVLEEPSLGMKVRNFYLDEKEVFRREAYILLIRSCIEKLKSVPASKANDTALQILAFERRIAAVTPTEEMKINITALYNKVTIATLEENFPEFKWQEYIQFLYPDKPISPDLEVIVNAWEYLKEFNTIMKKNNLVTKVNYLMWRWFKEHFLPDLPPPYQHYYKEFNVNVYGIPFPRWLDCVETTNTIMNMATGALYVQQKFDENSKQEAVSMINNIIESFQSLLVQESWLTEHTKEKAIEKANAMIAKIGYPDFLRNESAVNDFYGDYKVTEGNYLATKFQFLQVHTNDSFKMLDQPVDKHEWITGPATVNAFYSPNHNTIIFPAGILQPVFYSEHFPRSLNYGGIGVVIGHEITHGFDDKGRLYDKDGTVQEWWDDSTVKKFEEKAQCMERQYSSYVLDQINVTINGRNTNGENIADNGGLKQAYNAYKKWEEKNGPEKLLPGLDLSHDQLFFLNYAQIWCGKMLEKELRMKVDSSVHSPGPIRVKGPLSNSKDFAKAYSCKPDSPMNPPDNKKCSIW